MPALQTSCLKCEALNTCCTECLLSGACVILKESISPRPTDYDNKWGSQYQTRPTHETSHNAEAIPNSTYPSSTSYQTPNPPPYNNYTSTSSYPTYNPYRSGTWDSSPNRGGYSGIQQDCGCKVVRVYKETPGETAPMTTVRVCPNNGSGQSCGRKNDGCEYVVIRGNMNNKGCQYEAEDHFPTPKVKACMCGHCQQKCTDQHFNRHHTKQSRQSSCPKRVVLVEQCDSETTEDDTVDFPLIVFQGPDLPMYNGDSQPAARQTSRQPTPSASVIRDKQKTMVCRTTEDGEYICEYRDRPEPSNDDPDSSNMCMIYRTTSNGEVEAIPCALKRHTEEEDERTDVSHNMSSKVPTRKQSDVSHTSSKVPTRKPSKR